jgi:C-terminal processing protease CtpA/Prc/ketosteroid isomerase-like protein
MPDRLAALLVTLLAAAPAAAPAAAQPLPPALRSRVVDSAARVLDANVHDPALGRRLAQRLREADAARAFAVDSTPDAFVAALRRVAREVTTDLHLNVLTPDRARELGAAPAVRMRPDDPALRQRTERERRRNYFFRAYEVLPGNVAYLALDQFAIPDAARETAAAAMRLLANADAVILDLRANPGGAEGLNQFLSSYFFDGTTPVVLYTRYDRVGDSTAVYRVIPDVPGPRMPDAPLYILVGGGTGSSAENMAYSLQALKRATVVGEPTAGGANSSRVFALPGGFLIQVPVARVINPVTGSNWEGRGVQPDVRVAAAAARDTAHALALRGLASRATDDGARAELQRALASLPAQPVAQPAGQPVRQVAVGERPPRNMGFGLIPRPDGTLTVTQVAPGSGAERAGLRDGDQLVELDGTPARAMSRDVMRAAAARDTPARVVVARDGRRLELRVAPHVEGPAAGAAGAAGAPDALRREVEALNAAMVAAFRRDPASVARFYTDDATIVGAGARHTGRAAVDRYWARATGFVDWTLEVLEVGGSPDAPWQRGRSTLVGQGGRRMVTEFLGVLRRGAGGALRFHVDMFTAAPGGR